MFRESEADCRAAMLEGRLELCKTESHTNTDFGFQQHTFRPNVNSKGKCG